MLPQSRCAVTPDTAGIAAAAQTLRSGGLVGLPTETVYGLAALATDNSAVSRVFATKGRPADHPLIVHIADSDQLRDWVRDVPDYAMRLAAELWPGPLTLILPKQERVSAVLTGGQDTVGLRVPSHPVAQAVIAAAGPVAAPSANRFGRVSPTSAAAVAEELSDVMTEQDLILDGGTCAVGIESTIVDCTTESPKVLRAGFYGDDVIAASAGVPLSTAVHAQGPRVPGSLAAHYAPRTPVRLLDASQVNALELSRLADAWLLVEAGEPIAPSLLHAAGRLTQPADANAYAQVLYATLRGADSARVTELLAVPPCGAGIAVAVRDRLQRAAVGSAAAE